MFVFMFVVHGLESSDINKIVAPHLTIKQLLDLQKNGQKTFKNWEIIGVQVKKSSMSFYQPISWINLAALEISRDANLVVNASFHMSGQCIVLTKNFNELASQQSMQYPATTISKDVGSLTYNLLGSTSINNNEDLLNLSLFLVLTDGNSKRILASQTLIDEAEKKIEIQINKYLALREQKRVEEENQAQDERRKLFISRRSARLAEEARQEAERLERVRLAEEAERVRLAEEAERVRLAEEARQEAERVRLAEEARLEAERLERVRQEQDRQEAERLRLAEEAERVRLAEEARLEAERLERVVRQEEAERVRLAEEARLEAERLERVRQEEAERLERVRQEEAERVRLAEEARLEAERLERVRQEEARLLARRPIINELNLDFFVPELFAEPRMIPPAPRMIPRLVRVAPINDVALINARRALLPVAVYPAPVIVAPVAHVVAVEYAFFYQFPALKSFNFAAYKESDEKIKTLENETIKIRKTVSIAPYKSYCFADHRKIIQLTEAQKIILQNFPEINIHDVLALPNKLAEYAALHRLKPVPGCRLPGRIPALMTIIPDFIYCLDKYGKVVILKESRKSTELP